MTNSNEQDTSSVAPSTGSLASSDTASSPSENAGSAPREGDERRPRRPGGGKHPFNKNRAGNKSRPRKEGGERPQGQRDHSNNQSAKLAPNPAESEALFASVVSGEFDAALDAPEVMAVQNPDGLNENDISHQTGAERRA